MSENKTGKYFKYAIGEIILVVIGILIALQINNWNEDRKDRRREQDILYSLKQDFSTNISNVNDAFNTFSEAYESSIVLLEIVKDNGPINSKEVEQLLDDIINKTKSLDIITGSLDELFNTGTFNLIKDEELRKQLSYWSFYVTDTEDDIVIYRNYLFDFFIPSLTNKSLLRNMEDPEFFENDLGLSEMSKSDFKLNYSTSLRTIEFENELYNNTLNYKYALNSYKVFNNYLAETLNLIESNIKD
ncbi:DUF6090 family protein [Winogradskyella sp. A2]|uniref:DUF6090 family protein n=1 Tax=Winogradskyella sp. A2 TaxID=3366944 RepID=UPI00398C6392